MVWDEQVGWTCEYGHEGPGEGGENVIGCTEAVRQQLICSEARMLLRVAVWLAAMTTLRFRFPSGFFPFALEND
ncbi:hypothetical protein BSZ35_08715 [Salinibacter sp. 10B]|nr:hypothetical protein BSZ35_08715 [Salinibacter sp. 10B]